MKLLYTIAISLLLFTSCNSENKTEIIEPIDYTAQNEADIVAYIAENELDATRSESGLYYVINEQGTGEQPTATSDVTVAYKGYFLNGNVFDESDEEGISFNLSGVIQGWTEGIQYFNEGGSGILLIPSSLGYGNNSNSVIPGGSVLLFDIDLIEVN
ncbi:FKBP-type peptidyl-prolyl cis-trans isomerase [Cellulophaga baltica]|uniref:FKBP-type peptidyl-prolyl cis-trans isomerase n=1 Tax=Cellulophaga TaxID=104264 RepID=UPI001C074B32|nr:MULTISPECIES: FKBP-type peptidyl-prolyl cis-trans isomerase [Cellulophaga]MBU2995806.1 FKBP-type peptidyl-prolyl cis-trans isomerase [Cellulophaga baltica]MDO6767201.1 FKBP-type peptidyl-prolyl cis-trans isomerase [Cellulophaga sp. 1_MG-2023]